MSLGMPSPLYSLSQPSVSRSNSMDGASDDLMSSFDAFVADNGNGPTDLLDAHGDQHRRVHELLLHQNHEQHPHNQLHHQQDYFMNADNMNDIGRVHEPPMMSLQPQGAQSMNIDATLRSLLATQNAMFDPHQQLPTSTSSAQALLEQQMRIAQLQQLQQLQNHLQHQIFQQQIEIISGQGIMPGSSLDTSTQAPNHGYRDPLSFGDLPTPAPSAELRAHQNTNYVSPMILQNYNPTPADTPMTQFASPPMHPQQGSSSAPANIAFRNSAMSSPIDMEFDLLTSPWLRPCPPSAESSLAGPSGASESSTTITRSTATKRTSCGDPSLPTPTARKKRSPAIRPTPTPATNLRRRGSSSVTSTPSVTARSRSRKSSTAGDGSVPTDTPSPVDLSMPPPAPPSSIIQTQSSADTSMDLLNISTSFNSGSNMTPVTPASVMGLDPACMSSGLSPPTNPSINPNPNGDGSGDRSNLDGSKNTSQSQWRASPGAARLNADMSSKSTSKKSPGLKPLLPGGVPTGSASQLATHSNYAHHLAGRGSSLNLTPLTPLPAPQIQERQITHKAAEQKRRDMLKATYDDLRLLLPPLPLPSDDGYDREPPLPGEMPPRGPPKGDTTGPNRAVSKLQLLRCGNDYIRQLKGRVDRRDEYIQKLKEEIVALRAIVGMDVVETDAGVVPVDLDLELDAVEIAAQKLSILSQGQGDEYDDGAD